MALLANDAVCKMARHDSRQLGGGSGARRAQALLARGNFCGCVVSANVCVRTRMLMHTHMLFWLCWQRRVGVGVGCEPHPCRCRRRCRHCRWQCSRYRRHDCDRCYCSVVTIGSVAVNLDGNPTILAVYTVPHFPSRHLSFVCCWLPLLPQHQPQSYCPTALSQPQGYCPTALSQISACRSNEADLSARCALLG